MPPNPVVITGLGVVSPIGLGREPFWEALVAGRSGIVSLEARSDGDVVPLEATRPGGLRIGGAVTDFDPKRWVRPRKALKVMCREIQTAFAASQMALEDAGLADVVPAEPDGVIGPDRIGTVFGSEMFYGPPGEMVDAFRHCLRDDGTVEASQFGGAAMKEIMPLWMLKYLPNMPACHVGISINAQGPNNTLVLGDISGPSALIEATAAIGRGLADVVFNGAVGTRINATRLNYRGDLPVGEIAEPISASCRPHDPSATGVIGGEAAATLVLESTESASARGARPLARVLATSSRFVPSPAVRGGNRSCRLEATSPRGSAAAVEAAIEAVLHAASISAEQVGLIVSHGMGDPSLDRAEREATNRILPAAPRAAPIAAFGHSGAASGMLGVVTGVAALAARLAPPTPNASAAAPDARLLSEAQELTAPYVLCLSHTTEGSATAILLG